MAGALDINMKSSDLIKKEPLDYGGFGEVHLCYHKTLGQVVMKTVYTGPQRNEWVRLFVYNLTLTMVDIHKSRLGLFGLFIVPSKRPSTWSTYQSCWVTQNGTKCPTTTLFSWISNSTSLIVIIVYFNCLHTQSLQITTFLKPVAHFTVTQQLQKWITTSRFASRFSFWIFLCQLLHTVYK